MRILAFLCTQVPTWEEAELGGPWGRESLGRLNFELASYLSKREWVPLVRKFQQFLSACHQREKHSETKWNTVLMRKKLFLDVGSVMCEFSFYSTLTDKNISIWEQEVASRVRYVMLTLSVMVLSRTLDFLAKTNTVPHPPRTSSLPNSELETLEKFWNWPLLQWKIYFV